MIKKICLSLLLLLALGGGAVNASLEDDLSISLEERQIQDLGLSGLNLVFYIKIKNSSPSAYYLSGYHYRLVVDHTEYIRMEMPLAGQMIRIDPASSTLLSFPLKITYAHLFQVVKGASEKDKALCYLSGAMRFSDGRREKGKLAFAFSGEFPIFKLPEVECLSIQVNDITIGGAELSFEARFKNRNGFELLVDSISYTVQLGEKPIGEGRIRGDKNMESRAEKDFSLPLLLNFFEVGRDVYDLLHQPSAVCRFTGELKCRTVWGRVTIPFDKQDKVIISRKP
ncbi:MAG: LEA type 2 family protein [Candidatus Aminicenantes bacterium]